MVDAAKQKRRTESPKQEVESKESHSMQQTSAPLSRGNASCAIVIRVPNESPRSDFPSRTNLNRSELGAPYHHLLMDQSKECLGIPVSAHPASTVARYNEWMGSAGPHKSLRSFFWLEIVDPWGLPLLLWPPPLIQTDRNILPMKES